MAKKKKSTRHIINYKNKNLYNRIYNMFRYVSIPYYISRKHEGALFKVLLQEYDQVLKELKNEPEKALNELKSKDILSIFIFDNRFEFKFRATSLIITK